MKKETKKEVKREEKAKKEPSAKKSVSELRSSVSSLCANDFESTELSNALMSKYVSLEKELKYFRNHQWTENGAVNKEFETIREDIEKHEANVKSINRMLHCVVDDLRKDVNEKHVYLNERLTNQASTHRLKIEQVKLEFQKVHKKNNELKSSFDNFLINLDNIRNETINIYDLLEPKINKLANDKIEIEKKLAKTEFILLGFIGLNFGLTIFLLINFFTVFDF